MKVKRNLLKKPHIIVSFAIAFFFLFISNTTISVVMASNGKKLAPIRLDIGGNSVAREVFDTLNRADYEIMSVGLIPYPYTITISLHLTNEELEKEKPIVTKKVEEILAARYIDDYKIKIEKFENVPPNELPSKSEEIHKEMLNLFPIISKTMKKFGYDTPPSIAYNDIKSGILIIELPNTEKRKKTIKQAVEKALKKEKFKIKIVEFKLYNKSKRLQDYRWSPIISTISDNLIGKSDYMLKGISYQIKNGKTYISLNTELDKSKSENVTYLKETFKKFFTLESTKTQIKKDAYELIIYGKSKQVLVKITKN
ncbi:hypothetical protein [Viridibacillus sp. FSL H8-0123]|uniref:hypothetical protein n=1 Tax=Viridibacillus sp. FSL H8-0123 TaxID=1928922 RepID=UPI00096ED67A|nr:hypothetical protein [Viridibacillus sp. FSL H8-0123]OMC85672.1 hypothetical protein BK130_02600 [Viridibacillus sp. FSL H8-0123]